MRMRKIALAVIAVLVSSFGVANAQTLNTPRFSVTSELNADQYKDVIAYGSDANGITESGTKYPTKGMRLRGTYRQNDTLTLEIRFSGNSLGAPRHWYKENASIVESDGLASNTRTSRNGRIYAIDAIQRIKLNSFTSLDLGITHINYRTATQDVYINNNDVSETVFQTTHTGPIGGVTLEHRFGKFRVGGEAHLGFMIERGRYNYEFAQPGFGITRFERAKATYSDLVQLAGSIAYRMHDNIEATASVGRSTITTLNSNYLMPDPFGRDQALTLRHRSISFGLTYRR